MGAVPATAAARALVAGLIRGGIRHACITPGSRSTPLTLAFAEQAELRAWLHLDERSAAFFGLGLARALGEPVALVCTSGTAAANYAPAVVEANLSRIPLIVCTTDRPPRLRDVGADQTIDQAGMFGRNVRWAADLPVPDGSPAIDAAFAAAAARAVRQSLVPLPGPVHLNVPFEEPLIEAPGARPAATPVHRGRLPTPAPLVPGAGDIEMAAEVLAAARRPLIVAGPETGGLPATSILALAEALDAPVLADALSGLRTGHEGLGRVLDSYDALLRDPRAGGLSPDAVIRFGGIPTSKALNQALAANHDAVQVLVDLPGSWRDPNGATTLAAVGSASSVAEALACELQGQRSEAGWRQSWLAADRLARGAMQAAAAGFAETFEGRVITELQAAVDPGTTIVAGNSMPVRDLDSFLVADEKPLQLASNRGANGIDGVVSSAIGAAAAARGPVVLVIGDLSFYHDMNGLWAAKRHALDLTIVLVNNNGGGIFHYLPQAGHPGVFEDWFGTRGDLDFEPAVRMYGGEFTRPGSWSEFREVVRPGHGLRVVEVVTDRARNAAMHREAWAAAAKAAWGPGDTKR